MTQRALVKGPPPGPEGQPAGPNAELVRQVVPLLQKALDDSALEVVVAAAEHPDYPRQQAQGGQIRPDLPERRSNHRSNKDHVAATFAPGGTAKPAQLAEPDPMVRIGLNSTRIRPTAQRKQDRRPQQTMGEAGKIGGSQSVQAASGHAG